MLESIGATSAIRAQIAPHTSRGLMLGRVSAQERDRYRLYTEEGEAEAEAIGALLYRGSLPAVGDWVAAQKIAPAQAMIHEILPRRTKFSRRAAGAREDEQVIAANIDVALVVCGLDGDFSLRRLERYLTLVKESGAAAAIALNKTDLCGEVEARRAEVAQIAGAAPVVALSARQSVEPLTGLLAGGPTVVLLGSSGAGKSTIANQLIGEERQRVQEVRAGDSRGRHTTTRRELIPLASGGALIDTPGLRELQLWAGPESLDAAFEDIARLSAECRFRNCAHQGEAGCAVKAALEEGRLDAGRWLSYRKLCAELAWHERRADVGAALAEKQRWKKIHKAARARSRW